LEGGIAVADIFISYSSKDRDKVEKLAAFLENEGWTVWFDRNLTVGGAYTDQQMKQLGDARAVIVLWTQNSIKSDFVRAEAGKAKADGKLIPLRVNDIAYGDIPSPFGEMHTEDLSNHELIRAAVVSHMAMPAMQPSAWWVRSRWRLPSRRRKEGGPAKPIPVDATSFCPVRFRAGETELVQVLVHPKGHWRHALRAARRADRSSREAAPSREYGQERYLICWWDKAEADAFARTFAGLGDGRLDAVMVRLKD
jgi:hypothetical protein